MKLEDFYAYFKIPSPGSVVPSGGPGTGPAQTDAQTNTRPASAGGSFVPAGGAANSIGYGGGGDVVQAKTPADIRDRLAGPIGPHGKYARQGPPPPLVPRYTVLYDTLRSRDAWRYCADAYVRGTITPTTSGDVNTVVTVTLNVSLIVNRLMQFPGGISFFLVIREFSAAPVASTATGAISWYFEDSLQNLAPLTDAPANASVSGGNLPVVMPSPLTDSGFLNLGKLHALSNTVATPALYVWQMGFSYAYQMPEPAFRGFDWDGHATNILAKESEGVQRRN